MDKNREERVRINDRLMREAVRLRISRQPKLPEELEDSIMNSIGKSRSRKTWLYFAVAAAAAVLLLVVLMIPRNNDTLQAITAGVDTTAIPVKPSAKTDKPSVATAATTKSTNPVYAKTSAESYRPGKKETQAESYAVQDKDRQPAAAVSHPSEELSGSLTAATYSADAVAVYVDDGPADPLTMFIETSADNAVLSSNSRRMAAEMGMDI